jgi:hypothetical protein
VAGDVIVVLVPIVVAGVKRHDGLCLLRVKWQCRWPSILVAEMRSILLLESERTGHPGRLSVRPIRFHTAKDHLEHFLHQNRCILPVYLMCTRPVQRCRTITFDYMSCFCYVDSRPRNFKASTHVCLAAALRLISLILKRLR